MVYKMTPRYLDKNILNSLKNECESVRNILELYFYTVTGSYSGQTAVKTHGKCYGILQDT